MKLAISRSIIISLLLSAGLLTGSLRANGQCVILGSNPQICEGTTLASVGYSINTGSPDGYSIDFDDVSFTDVGISTLPSSPITFSVPGGATPGTYTATITFYQSSISCIAIGFSIIVDETPTTATVAPTPLNYCGTLVSGSLGGNTPTAGTGAWSIFSGGTGTFSAGTSGTSTFTANAYGTYVLRWTISNGTCTPSTADVTVNYYQTPTTATAGPPQNLCEATTATLAGNTPTVGTGAWSLVSGSGTITTPSSPTSGVTGLSYGANTFRWTISNGVCTASTSDVTITRYVQPIVSNQPNQTLCNTSSFTMTQSAPSVGTGVWTLVSGTATITTPSSSTTTVTGLVAGTTATVRWTVTNGTCSAFDDVVITNNLLPTANAGGPNIVCQSPTPVAITLTGASVGGGATTGAWSIIGGSGSLSSTNQVANPATITFTPAANFSGTVTLRLTTNDPAGPCDAVISDRTITVNPLPTAANAGTDITICNGDNVSMLANSAGGGEAGAWTIINGPSTSLAQFNPTTISPTATFTPTGGGGTYVLRWSITNTTTGCFTTDDVLVSVNAVAAGTFQNPSAICDGGSVLLDDVLNGSGSGTLSYRWMYSIDDIEYDTIKPSQFSEFPQDVTYTTFPLSFSPVSTHYFKRVVISTLNGVSCKIESSAITVTVSNTQSPIRTSQAGTWHTAGPWTKSTTPFYPIPNDGSLGCPVSVNHPMTLNQNLVITDGVFSINDDVTDNVSPAHNLSMATTSKNYDATKGLLEIGNGSLVQIGGVATVLNSTIVVRSGGKLVIGPQELEVCNCWWETENRDLDPGDSPYDPVACAELSTAYREQVRLTLDKKSRITVEEGGMLVVYGSVVMLDPQNRLLVNGEIFVTGNFASNNGSSEVVQDVLGQGDMYTCGTMTSQGSSTIYGTTNDCTSTSIYANPPCQASALNCNFSATLNPSGIIGWCNDTEITGGTSLGNVTAFKWEYTTQTDNTGWDWVPEFDESDPTDASTFAPPQPVSDVYYRLRVSGLSEASVCTKFSPVVRVRPSINTWRGNELGFSKSPRPYDWDYEENWCIAVPASTEDVIITNGTPFIYHGTIAEVNNLSLNSSSVLTLSDAYGTDLQLLIYGNLVNDGAVLGEAGTVTFTGPPAGNYMGSIFNPGTYQFYDLIIDKDLGMPAGNTITMLDDFIVTPGNGIDLSATGLQFTGSEDQLLDLEENPLYNVVIDKTDGNVTLDSKTDLFGRIDILSASEFNATNNTYLTIRSTSASTSGDGSFGPVASGGSISGTIKVERYMGSITHDPFRYVASPVNNGVKPASLNKLYRYDQALGWVGATSSAMNIGNGFAALTYNGGAQVWSVTNTVHTGPHTWNNLQAGWNLLGNPYPSAIQWSDPDLGTWSFDKTRISATIGITDNSISGYPNYFRYYDFITGAQPTYDSAGNIVTWGKDIIDGPGIIAMGQAFWVYVDQATNLTITENAKVSAGQSGSFYRSGENRQYDQLLINLDNGSIGDQTYLKIHDRSTDDFDLSHDLPKLWNERMNVFLLSASNMEMLMNTVRSIEAEVKIPLGVKVSEPGEYHLTFGVLGESSNLSELFLIDKFEGVAIPVSNSEPYSFVVKDSGKAITDRFYLSKTPDVQLNKENLVSVYPNPVTNHLNVEIKGQKGASQIILFDLSGKVLKQGEISKQGSVDVSDFTSGIYILKVQTEQGIFVQKFEKHD